MIILKDVHVNYFDITKNKYFTQWLAKSPRMAAGPKVLAGFMLDPVKGTAKRWQVVMDNPIAKGADPLTLGALCSSAAAP